ncbi:MAG: hypothetical protein K0U78_01925 [Actinomycetia bacterium]|nr:hypothetical protein [Actinomycetes bacterium]
MPNDAPVIPIGRILRLVTKAVRYSKGGFTRAERLDLGLALLELAGDVLDKEMPAEHKPYALDRPDAVR